MLITLPDGRRFPSYEGLPLAWSSGLYMTTEEERAGYPRARAVLAEMSSKDLLRERAEAIRDSLGGLFGHNAKKHLALVEAELMARKAAGSL